MIFAYIFVNELSFDGCQLHSESISCTMPFGKLSPCYGRCRAQGRGFIPLRVEPVFARLYMDSILGIWKYHIPAEVIMKKYIALALVLATPSVLAETINMACPPGDEVRIHTVTNNGDFNGDGMVDLGDYQMLRNNFGITTGPDQPLLETDLNADGTTNLTDYSLFRMLLSQQ